MIMNFLCSHFCFSNYTPKVNSQDLCVERSEHSVLHTSNSHGVAILTVSMRWLRWRILTQFESCFSSKWERDGKIFIAKSEAFSLSRNVQAFSSKEKSFICFEVNIRYGKLYEKHALSKFRKRQTHMHEKNMYGSGDIMWENVCQHFTSGHVYATSESLKAFCGFKSEWMHKTRDGW